MNRPGKPTSDRHSLAVVLSGSAFIFLCRVAGAALTFGTQILLARWMGAAELGTYVLVFSWAILLATLATTGFPAAALRFVGEGLAADDPGYIRGFVRRGEQIVLAMSLAALVAGIAVVWSAPSFLQSATREPLLTALLAVPFLALMTFQGGVANALSRLSLSFVPTNVIRPLLFLVAIAALGAAGGDVTAAAAMTWQWVAAMAVALGTTIASKRLLTGVAGGATARYETRRWVRVAAPLMAVSLFTAYFPELLIILAGSWLPSDELAVFHIAYRIALLIAFGIFAVDAFTAPEAARLHAEGNLAALQEVTNHATRLRFWASAAAVAALAAAGEWLLGLFGAAFVAGYQAMIVLAFAQLVQAAVGPVTRLMSVSGHQDRCLVVFGWALALAVLLVAVLVPRYGIMGAALAAFLDITFWSLWMRYLVVRHLGIRPSLL